jgi:hypothetical protein
MLMGTMGLVGVAAQCAYMVVLSLREEQYCNQCPDP